MGFAPTASSLARKRSTAELHPHNNLILEAWAGIAPAHRGFADLCLTAWLPRRTRHDYLIIVWYGLM